MRGCSCSETHIARPANSDDFKQTQVLQLSQRKNRVEHTRLLDVVGLHTLDEPRPVGHSRRLTITQRTLLATCTTNTGGDYYKDTSADERGRVERVVELLQRLLEHCAHTLLLASATSATTAAFCWSFLLFFVEQCVYEGIVTSRDSCEDVMLQYILILLQKVRHVVRLCPH